MPKLEVTQDGQTGGCYSGGMDFRTYRFCVLARELVSSHGLSFAAAFLSENGIGIDIALAVLAPRRNASQAEHRDILAVYPEHVMVTYGDAKRGPHWRSN